MPDGVCAAIGDRPDKYERSTQKERPKIPESHINPFSRNADRLSDCSLTRRSSISRLLPGTPCWVLRYGQVYALIRIRHRIRYNRRQWLPGSAEPGNVTKTTKCANY